MSARKNDFSKEIKDNLFKNCGGYCSNPNCRCVTSYASKNKTGKTVLLGEACHIISCSKDGGARKFPEIDDETRKSYDNAIWLCAKCHTLIDKNENEYTVELLHKWKDDIEKEQRGKALNNDNTILRVEKLNKYDLRTKDTLNLILKYINEIKEILININDYYKANINIDDEEKLKLLINKNTSCLNKLIMPLTIYNKKIMEIKSLSFKNKKNFSNKINQDLSNLTKANSNCFKLEGTIPLKALTSLLFSLIMHCQIINEVFDKIEVDINEYIN